jgi:hypothetical protein
MRSLRLILVSIFLWFTAYNAVTTAFSRYAVTVWKMEGGGFASCLLVATGAAKADAIRQLVCGGEVTTHNPSTFLKLHADAWVVIDRALAEAAGYNG